MQVKILKASSPEYWYADHINEIFNGLQIGENFIVIADFRLYKWVDGSDCVVLNAKDGMNGQEDTKNDGNAM